MIHRDTPVVSQKTSMTLCITTSSSVDMIHHDTPEVSSEIFMTLLECQSKHFKFSISDLRKQSAQWNALSHHERRYYRISIAAVQH